MGRAAQRCTLYWKAAGKTLLCAQLDLYAQFNYLVSVQKLLQLV